MNLLVLDAYAPDGRAALRGAGGSEAGALYARTLARLAPEAVIDVAHPADGDLALPPGVALADYDGVVWTGSSLSLCEPDDPRVARQIALARALFERDIPSFGSCFAAQLAAVAAGGACARSPRGREFGVSRPIALSTRGRAHPLYRGKPPVFEAFTSHQDEIVRLPSGAECLASNDWSDVQALCVERGAGAFWAVQYHPEFDAREVAALCRLRAAALAGEGRFASPESALAWAADLEALHREPGRSDLQRALGIVPELLDFDARTQEVRNWLETCVRGARRD